MIEADESYLAMSKNYIGARGSIYIRTWAAIRLDASLGKRAPIYFAVSLSLAISKSGLMILENRSSFCPGARLPPNYSAGGELLPFT
jgi:hypothetical protein